MAPLFRRIIPILFVSDLRAERDFYLRLGFRVTYEGPEYPYFLALGHGPVEFGIEWHEGFSPAGPDRVLTWQFGVSDLDEAKKLFEVGRGAVPRGADDAERRLAVPRPARQDAQRVPPAARGGQRLAPVFPPGLAKMAVGHGCGPFRRQWLGHGHHYRAGLPARSRGPAVQDPLRPARSLARGCRQGTRSSPTTASARRRPSTRSRCWWPRA